MFHPKVTVLMSVFNGSVHLGPAVESILKQTFGDFEFLILDDGSTEPVVEQILNYKDDRVRIIRQENMGLTKSLNRGLSLAECDYVARMDADDISLPDRLQKQFHIISRTHNIDLIGTFFEIMDESKNIIERKYLITEPIYRLWRLQFHNNYGHGTMMFRKASVIAAGMYDSRLRFAQDYDLWSRISRKDNTHIIPEFLYQYRVDGKGPQASVKNYNDQLQSAIWISDRNLRASNPSLTDAEIVELRSLYWEFQLSNIAETARSLALKTLETFAGKYRLDSKEKTDLLERILEDIGTIES
ncbi:MAG: glycosyltransferase [Desulfomonilaceae bacterium]